MFVYSRVGSCDIPLFSVSHYFYLFDAHGLAVSFTRPTGGDAEATEDAEGRSDPSHDSQRKGRAKGGSKERKWRELLTRPKESRADGA